MAYKRRVAKTKRVRGSKSNYTKQYVKATNKRIKRGKGK